MSNPMKYETITTRSFTDLIATSKKLSSSQRTVNKHEGSTWANLLGWFEEHEGFNMSSLHALEDKKLIMKELKKMYQKEAKEKTGDSKIKFSQDDRTKVASKYLGDIAKILLSKDSEGEAVHLRLLPGDNTVAPRCGILALCQGSTLSALEKFKLALGNAEKSGITEDDALLALQEGMSLVGMLSTLVNGSDVPPAIGSFDNILLPVYTQLQGRIIK